MSFVFISNRHNLIIVIKFRLIHVDKCALASERTTDRRNLRCLI